MKAQGFGNPGGLVLNWHETIRREMGAKKDLLAIPVSLTKLMKFFFLSS